jgi:hypothetical protein
MLQRVLAVSFAQVLRSVAILLLPFAFIALVAWTTAGSVSGNTSDPIRAALWLWLGSHHVPFSLILAPASSAGFLSYLPMGAIFLPIFAIRSGFNRALERLHGDYHSAMVVRFSFSTFYALIATGLAWLSRSDGVTPVWYLATLLAFLLAFLTSLTCGVRVKISRPVLFASRALAIVLGLSFIFLSALIFLNLKTLGNITTVLEPGFIGGLLLFLLNVLYLPNAAVAVLSYFAGSGFAVGAETIISPFSHSLGTIPAFPLLATLPTSTSRWSLFVAIGIVATGALLASWAMLLRSSVLIQTIFFIAIFAAVLGYLAGGSLITDSMGAIGVSAWKFPLALTLEMGLGALLIIAIPLVRVRVGRR